MPLSRKPLVPKGSQPWPSMQQTGVLTVPQIKDLYAKGFQGTIYNEAERDALLESMPNPDGEQVCYDAGIVESGKGKLSLPIHYAEAQWHCWPKPAQQTGDCTSRAGGNVSTIVIGVDVAAGLPDEMTGLIEGFPVLSAEGIKNGVVAVEPIYGDRGHSGEGASCDRLIRHLTQLGGVVLRRNYPDLNLDLTKLNTKLGIGWGRTQTPEAVRTLGKSHQIRQATAVPGWEQARDLVANGNPLWVCSGLGFSDQRDENGVSKKQGSWSHSWTVGGFDDRPWTYQKYGFPLALFIHDWAEWNEGPRRIKDTQMDIPIGCFWFDARLLNQCDVYAVTSVNGWPRPNLPDLLGGW